MRAILLILFFSLGQFSCSQLRPKQNFKGRRYPSSRFNCRSIIKNIIGGVKVQDEKGYLNKLSGRVSDLRVEDLEYIRTKLPFIRNEIISRKRYLKLLLKKAKRINNDDLWKEIYYLEALISTAPKAHKLISIVNRINNELPLTANHEQVLKEIIYYLRVNLDSIKVNKLGKQVPINSHLAGGQFPMNRFSSVMLEKYPAGVWFNNSGFPNFYAYALRVVEVEVTGVGRFDFARANKAAGIDKIPDHLTWHHHQDGKTMLLIPRDIHDLVKHTGGVALITKDIKRIRGALPAGTEWAGKRYPKSEWSPHLRAKYPNSVSYKLNGYPNLNPYSTYSVQIRGTGKKNTDFQKATKKASFKELPRGMTWHLKEDGVTMQLVPLDLIKAIPYTAPW